MANITTLPVLYHPLMGKPSMKLAWCAVCGRAFPLEQHHIVFRSAGKLFDERGCEVEKPTITLCGFGNNLKDADGREFCHGLAHAKRLHFRWVESSEHACTGHYEYILLDTPTKYLKALGMDGWRSIWER